MGSRRRVAIEARTKMARRRIALYQNSGGALPGARGVRLLPFLAILVLAGCSEPPKQALLHHYHRQNYSLTDKELRSLRFFTSEEILVRDDGPTGLRSVLVPRCTPGVCTEVGPTWIKLIFRRGTAPVPFVTDPSREEDVYWLASPVPGRSGFRKVMDSPDKIFHGGPKPYRVIQGEATFLRVKHKNLREILDKRRGWLTDDGERKQAPRDPVN